MNYRSWIGAGLAPRSRTARWTQFMAGLLGMALGIALMIRSDLGLGPWDTFHVGLHLLTGMTVGTASIVAGVLVVCVAWFFGARPGTGTLVNMLMIGVFTDLLLPVVPAAPHWSVALAYYGVAIVLVGICGGMYIAVELGKGPRDGLTLALADRSGWTVSRVRTVTELLVLAIGWMMGGPVGVGTVLFSVLIGASMQWGLRVYGIATGAPAAVVETATLGEEMRAA